MSLFTSFGVGVSGIRTAQSGLNTSSHNISNTKTLGYTRQQNIQRDIYYQTYKDTDRGQLQVGYGSTVAAIRQIRDKFLDEEYRTESSRLSFYEVQQTAMNEVYDILGEMDGVEFNIALNEMWSSIQDLDINPEEVARRETFIAQAEKFLDTATAAYQSLKDYQMNLNSQIRSQVKAINDIADEIAELNMSIARIEASGIENANDYRDRRNYLMDELSKYTYYDSNEAYNGMVTIRINNAPLVEDINVYHMACEKIYDYGDVGQYKNSYATQMLKVVWEKGGFGDVYDLDKAYNKEDNSDTGSLLGILKARGKRFGYYTDIPQKEDYLPGLPWQNAVDEYNNTVGDCILERTEAQLDFLVNKVVKAINDALAPNLDLTGYTAQDAAGNAMTNVISNGTTIDLTQVKVLDANRCPAGSDDKDTVGTELFIRRAQPERYTVYNVAGPIYVMDNGKQVPITKEVVDAAGNTSYQLYVYNEEDETDVNTLYTLQNLEMNGKVLENYNYLPVKGNPDNGAYGTYDRDVYKNMLDKWNEKNIMLDPNSKATYETSGYYRALVDSLAVEGSVINSMVENQENLTNNIEDKRQQISGVATEEEMVSLLMYQHAYNAASRYITVIDSMLEHIINRLG